MYAWGYQAVNDFVICLGVFLESNLRFPCSWWVKACSWRGHESNTHRPSKRIASERDEVVLPLCLGYLWPCLTNANNLSQNVDGQFFHDPFVTGLCDVDIIALYFMSPWARAQLNRIFFLNPKYNHSCRNSTYSRHCTFVLIFFFFFQCGFNADLMHSLT